MNYYLINLKRTPERLANFISNNPGFEFTRFEAVDGQNIDRTQLIEQNVITQSIANRYTSGAIGVALSHQQLWQKCIELGESITVIEDDAYLNKNFKAVVEHNTAINDGWDFIYWGSNLDQKIVVEMIPSVTLTTLETDANLLVNNINRFQNLNISTIFYKCLFAVGLVCYSVSPKGARYLLDTCFPLRDYDKPYLNFGIDHSVLETLPEIMGYIVIPPLALTTNNQSESTVQNEFNSHR